MGRRYVSQLGSKRITFRLSPIFPVVRAFVRLREMLSTHRELATKLSELEHKLDTHDHAIQEILDAIRELMEPPNKPQKQIGFRTQSREKREKSGDRRNVFPN